MKILTTGCSFTHAPDSWANYLKDQYDLINVPAQGGAGNDMNIKNANDSYYLKKIIKRMSMYKISR